MPAHGGFYCHFPSKAAWSFDKDPIDRIRVQFEPFAIPGGGASVSGPLLRMEQVIEQSGPDAETKDQYFILADGSASKWLAHRYSYVRREAALVNLPGKRPR